MNRCVCYKPIGYDTYENEEVGKCYRGDCIDGMTCRCGGYIDRCELRSRSRSKSNQTPPNPKIIAVDFDGTLCEDKWPEIGEPKQNVIDYIKAEHAAGSKIILWTCREGTDLLKAIMWCMKQRLIFDAVNENLPEIIEQFGGDRRKIFAHEYIDDKAVLPKEVK